MFGKKLNVIKMSVVQQKPHIFYGTKVRILDGFHQYREGIVIDIKEPERPWTTVARVRDERPQYLVKFTDDEKKWFYVDNLELVDGDHGKN